MSDLNKPPVLFSPAEDIDKVSSGCFRVSVFDGVISVDIDGIAGFLSSRHRQFNDRSRGPRQVWLSLPSPHRRQASHNPHTEVPQPLSTRRRQKRQYPGQQYDH